MNINKNYYLSAVLALALTGCSTTKGLQDLSRLTPVAVDYFEARKTDLSDEQLKRWSHLDIIKDSVPGMSVDRAYEEIIKGRKGQKVIVGVIDSGVEIDHEDLKDAIWTNPKDKEGNKTDDDKNGYVDDIHGWNFLGKSNAENLELTRIVKKGDDGSATFKKAKAELDKKLAEAKAQKAQIDMMWAAKEKVENYLLEKDSSRKKGDEITAEDIKTIQTDDAELKQAVAISQALITQGIFVKLDDYKEYIDGQVNYHYNVDFDGRSVVGDNVDDITDTDYGDNDVLGNRDHAKHGTHVSGIIAQTRHNKIGGDGVASEVAEIMSVRAVPDGDEYDKDIALAIRYAVDNGAKVINGSFGKYYATHPGWVYDAIKYADSKDVLIVVAAGNDAKDLNIEGGVERYPTDSVEPGSEFASNFLVVGALNPVFGEGMVADFSNFGHYDVDVFAPGVEIYATTPYGKYEFLQGTSMASPNVAGVATLIRSYFPDLTASEVKKVIMDSGVPVTQQVIVAGKDSDKRNFQDISVSGKFVNAYNALILADKVSKAKK